MTLFLLKLSFCWGFFALLYVMLLRHETFFRANRMYLLGTALLGVLLAALPGEHLPAPMLDEQTPVVQLPAVAIGLQQVEVAEAHWESLSTGWIIYWAGVCITLLRVLWGIVRIFTMAVRGRSEPLPDGCLLVETREAKVPFSFFKWIFVPRIGHDGTETQYNPLMLAHERAHAHGWHSADVLFAELLCVMFWFHPLAHWYRRALRNVHEYLADAEASQLSDRKQYGLLLIGQSQSGMSIAFANHFFQSPLKQRLIMLTKQASAPVKAVKFGLVAPIALLFAILFRQTPAIAQAVDEKHLAFVQQLEANNWESTDTVITFNPDTYEETVQYVKNSNAPERDAEGKLVYFYAEQQPQFPGGDAALSQYLANNIKYPENAAANHVEGTVVVSFVVDENGNVIRPMGQIDMPNDAKYPLVEEAVRVVKAMPKWTPARHKGKAVRCSLRIPVRFAQEKSAPRENNVQPEFPGGQEALMNYLVSNIKYPQSGAEGVVLVSFVVKEDGSLKDIEVLNADKIHTDLAAEAVRVVQIMPAWKPGIQDGKVIKTRFTLPIAFRK